MALGDLFICFELFRDGVLLGFQIATPHLRRGVNSGVMPPNQHRDGDVTMTKILIEKFLDCWRGGYPQTKAVNGLNSVSCINYTQVLVKRTNPFWSSNPLYVVLISSKRLLLADLTCPLHKPTGGTAHRQAPRSLARVKHASWAAVLLVFCRQLLSVVPSWLVSESVNAKCWLLAGWWLVNDSRWPW